MKYLLKIFLAIAVLSVTLACQTTERTSFNDAELNVHFKYPAHWQPPVSDSQREYTASVWQLYFGPDCGDECGMNFHDRSGPNGSIVLQMIPNIEQLDYDLSAYNTVWEKEFAEYKIIKVDFGSSFISSLDYFLVFDDHYYFVDFNQQFVEDYTVEKILYSFEELADG